ncbi:hypothetical protein [Sphingobacterium sp.]|uniref:hypothetical protein n=1 Tax=Sphingobacterium sp. TaxID=341027 RepID=UPI0028AC923F|nr:hypothetical protein [Sphingobacterium sp.]
MNATKKITPSGDYTRRMLRRLPWLADLAPVHRPYFHGAFREPKETLTINAGDLVITPTAKSKRRPTSSKPFGKISLFLYVRFGSRAVPELRSLKLGDH